MKTKVSERGQLTIPNAVRERLGIRPGQVREVREQDGGGVVCKAGAADSLEAVTGVIETASGAADLIESIRGEGDAV